MKIVAAAVVAAALPFGGVTAEPLFEPCRACHAVEHGASPAAGPNLAGLSGRKVGGDRDFDYSPVLAAAFASGLTWDAARLDRFLEDPDTMFPGLWMSSRGIADAAERRALVRFLIEDERR